MQVEGVVAVEEEEPSEASEAAGTSSPSRGRWEAGMAPDAACTHDKRWLDYARTNKHF